MAATGFRHTVGTTGFRHGYTPAPTQRDLDNQRAEELRMQRLQRPRRAYGSGYDQVQAVAKNFWDTDFSQALQLDANRRANRAQLFNEQQTQLVNTFRPQQLEAERMRALASYIDATKPTGQITEFQRANLAQQAANEEGRNARAASSQDYRERAAQEKQSEIADQITSLNSRLQDVYSSRDKNISMFNDLNAKLQDVLNQADGDAGVEKNRQGFYQAKAGVDPATGFELPPDPGAISRAREFNQMIEQLDQSLGALEEGQGNAINDIRWLEQKLLNMGANVTNAYNPVKIPVFTGQFGTNSNVTLSGGRLAPAR